MKHGEMYEKIVKLEHDTKRSICIDDDGIELFVLRPSVLPKRFQGYDINKNFQIWLRDGERGFKPNHLRVMIDLNLRFRSRPDLKKDLLFIFDNIFYGADPDKEIKMLEKEHFEHSLNSLKIIANLNQLFIIEQEYNYAKESKFDPPTLFYQGWVREMIDSPKEIDNLCMSVCNGQPPQVKYTHKENRKHKDFQNERKELWYLGE